jgi:hypothetical protein
VNAHRKLDLEFRLVDVAELVFHLDAVPDAVAQQ